MCDILRDILLILKCVIYYCDILLDIKMCDIVL